MVVDDSSSLPERVRRTYLIVNFDLTTKITGNILATRSWFCTHAYILRQGVCLQYDRCTNCTSIEVSQKYYLPKDLCNIKPIDIQIVCGG